MLVMAISGINGNLVPIPQLSRTLYVSAAAELLMANNIGMQADFMAQASVMWFEPLLDLPPTSSARSSPPKKKPSLARTSVVCFYPGESPTQARAADSLASESLRLPPASNARSSPPKKKSPCLRKGFCFLAETVGVEPTIQV